jgi:TM2 domain-containing membrane protein YozV
MNCVNHPETAAAAYCRTCGKALCENCRRDVRGIVYCEECIASRLQDPAAIPGVVPAAPAPVNPNAPSAALATVLGFIPGVGAMYNGQFMKGFIHVLIFASLIWAAERTGFFGIFIPFFIFYMVFDAYKTARARERGEPLPDPFGFTGAVEGTRPEGAREFAHAPVGAIVLIGLGVLFLLDNLGLFHFHWIGRMWPLILIVLGVWLFLRRWSGNDRDH